MAETSTIEWTDSTWNPITGCTLVSEGCRHCYAAQLAATRLRSHPSRAGLARVNAAGEAKFTGEVRLNEQWLDQPLRWRRPRRIFVCAHGDLFHEAVPDEWIDRVFAAMALAPQHTFQVLTKRPERAACYLARRDGRGRIPAMDYAALMAATGRYNTPALDLRNWPLPQVWLGTSVEDQATADARIPHLLAAPAAVRFLSAEPLLGPVDLEPWLAWPDGGCELPDGRYFGCAGCDGEAPGCDCPRDRAHYEVDEGPRDATGCPEYVHAERITLDWVIVGGESGRHARPMHPDWARSLRDQCQAAGVPFFFKQWGEWAPSTPEEAFANPRSGWRTIKGHPHVARREELHPEAGAAFIEHMGKTRAGRDLDGRTWDEMPGPQA